MKDRCISCGREHEDEKLAELQDLSKQSLRSEIQVGDKVRLSEDWGIVEEGTVGIVGRIDDGEARVTFNYQTPFDLEMLKEHGTLSISGGPIKKIPIDDLESTTEVTKTSLHKESPTGVGDTPQVTIYSQVWEYSKGDSE